MFISTPKTSKAININKFKRPAERNCWVSLADKEYYFKPGAGTLESFSGELYRFALGPDVITEMLPVIDDSGRVVGILSEKITDGTHYTNANKHFPELPKLNIETRIKLQLGSLCAAVHVLNEQDGNSTNIFVRKVGKGNDISQFRFSIIDVDRSLGQALTNVGQPVSKPDELKYIIIRMPPDLQALAGGISARTAKIPDFQHQAYFTYLTLSLLDIEAVKQLAQDHFHTDEVTYKLAVEAGSKFVGEHLRTVCLQNPEFTAWLQDNKEDIKQQLCRHVEKFNEYKRKENPEKYKTGFIAVEKVAIIVDEMCARSQPGKTLRRINPRAFPLPWR